MMPVNYDDINDEFLDAVCDEVGQDHTGWIAVSPYEIIAAAVNLALRFIKPKPNMATVADFFEPVTFPKSRPSQRRIDELEAELDAARETINRMGTELTLLEKVPPVDPIMREKALAEHRAGLSIDGDEYLAKTRALADEITEEWFREEISGGADWVRTDTVQIGIDEGNGIYALAVTDSADFIRITTFTTKTAVRQFCDAVGIKRKL